MEMVSYLVMKNNVKRLMAKKSTYIVMLVLPILLVIIGTISVRIENRQIRVGVLGSEPYVTAMITELQNIQGVSYQIADSKTIHTDTIMGKYHYVLEEQRSNDTLQCIKEFAKQRRDERMTVKNAGNRMVSMLLSVYMTIATLYSMKYIQDKREQVVERVLVYGGTKASYVTGCFLSTVIVTGVQMAMILTLWNVLDENYTFSLVETCLIWGFSLLVSNLYGIMICIFSKSEMMAGVLASSGAVLCSLLGGTFMAVTDMPHMLQVFSKLSPISWLLQLL